MDEPSSPERRPRRHTRRFRPLNQAEQEAVRARRLPWDPALKRGTEGPEDVVVVQVRDTAVSEQLAALEKIHDLITAVPHGKEPSSQDLWDLMLVEGLIARMPHHGHRIDARRVLLRIYGDVAKNAANDSAVLGTRVDILKDEVRDALPSGTRYFGTPIRLVRVAARDVLRPIPSTTVQGSQQPLDPAATEVAAPAAAESIEHSLASLFLRLGPPPDPTELDYSPAGRGDGGAQQ